MKPIQKLDAVLHFMASPKNLLQNVQYDDIKNEIPNKYSELKNDISWGSDIYRVLAKLQGEGYITIFEIPVDNNLNLSTSIVNYEKRYIITFDGKLLSERGGYTGKYKHEKIKTRWLNVATWVTALGTGIAGLYSIGQILKIIICKD